MLASIVSLLKNIVVVGSHGKTTTTSLITSIYSKFEEIRFASFYQEPSHFAIIFSPFLLNAFLNYRKKTIEAEGDSIQFNQGEKPFKVYDANGNQLSTGKDGDSVFRTAFRKKIEDREWEERFGDKKKEYDPTGINRVDLYDANGNKIDFSKTKLDISTSSAAQMLGGGIETYDKKGNKVDISDDYTANQAVKQQRKTKRDEKAEERSLLTPYQKLEQDTTWDQRYINNTFPEEREYFDSMHVDKAKKDKRFRERGWL
mgnify:CR=1 FL=1